MKNGDVTLKLSSKKVEEKNIQTKSALLSQLLTAMFIKDKSAIKSKNIKKLSLFNK